jgi:hypothetical protein
MAIMPLERATFHAAHRRTSSQHWRLPPILPLTSCAALTISLLMLAILTLREE